MNYLSLRLVLALCLVFAAACSDDGNATTNNQTDDAALIDASDIAAQDAADTVSDTRATDVSDTADQDAAPQPIALDIDLSGGSLNLAATTVSDTTIALAGRESFYDGEWKWFYFRATNTQDKTPQFTIATNFADDVGALDTHTPVYSYDRQTWHIFDNHERDEQAGEFRFSNDGAFEQDTVFVALGIPYTTDDVDALVSELSQSQWVSKTVSSNDDLVLGQSPGGTDDLGRTVQPHDIYGFEITDPSTTGPKAKIVLTAGIHANEPTGNHVLEGLLRWLVGDGNAAGELRKRAIFYVYPLVNPDGYAAGHDRGSVAKPDTDANRVFTSGQWDGHAEVKLVGESMLTDTGGKIDYLLDFHHAFGQGPRYAYLDADGDPTGLEMSQDPFWQKLLEIANAEGRDASLGYDTAMKFGWQSLRATFVATFEPHHQPNWKRANYHNFGANIGRAFAQVRDTFGELELDMNFDSGSLDLANTTVNGDIVSLAGRDNYNGGRWKWIYFRAKNVVGRQLDFEIGDNFASGSSRISNHKFVYSYDQQSWHFFDNGGLSGGKYRFSNNAPFSQNTVYIAYGLPYPLQMAVDLVDQAKQSQWASPTSSADANFVIGQTAGGTDDLGRAIGPHDLYGFKITDSSASGPKQKVVLVAGVHSNETPGNHTLHGLVEWLLGSSNKAADLRRDSIFYVYPMVNPDGRFAGYNRSTVQAEGEDPNRQWSSSNWGNNQEIRVVGQAIVADTGGDVDYFMDFHSTVGTAGHYAYTDVDRSPTGINMSQSTFWQALEGREAVYARDGSFIGRTGMRYGWAAVHAEFSMTHETYFRPNENVARFRDFGKNVGLSLWDAISP